MMVILLFLMFSICFNNIRAGFQSNCEVQDVDRYDWLGSFTFKSKINDVHEGIFATLTTANIKALTGQSSEYLSATFENGILTVSTNENFKKFEEEYNQHQSSSISLELDFDCADGKSETLTMRQPVKDTNNHDPVFDKKIYEYNFGIIIPENYELTKFQSIKVTDIDFSNRDVYFTADFNEDFQLKYHVEEDYYNKGIYYTTLKALKPIRPPFRREFTLVAKDGGDPARTSTALLIVNVTSNAMDDGDENVPHPPVFSKHLYYANYTSYDELKMEESIKIKYGFEKDTLIKQSGYEEYFKASLESTNTGTIKVSKVKPLPRNILNTKNFIVIEVEALNEDLQIPGRTALIIELPNIEQDDSEDGSGSEDSDNDTGNSGNNCTVTYDTNHDSPTALIVCLCTMFVMAVINVVVFIRCFRRRYFIG